MGNWIKTYELFYVNLDYIKKIDKITRRQSDWPNKKMIFETEIRITGVMDYDSSITLEIFSDEKKAQSYIEKILNLKVDND